MQERLRMQKEQSDADNEWLKSEDVRSYAPPGSANSADAKLRLSKRHSWKEGVRILIEFILGTKEDADLCMMMIILFKT